MRAVRSVCYAILAVTMLATANLAMAQSTPVSMLDRVANKVISSLRANKASIKSNPYKVNGIVYQYFIPHVDVAGMSRSVLGMRVWRSSSRAQRIRFSRVFTRLVINTYSSALSQYTDEKVEFFPIRGGVNGKKRIQVKSKIVRSKGPDIPMSYRLVRKGSSWKIYDMSVEGISLLANFRSQIRSELSKKSLGQLTDELAVRNRG